MGAAETIQQNARLILQAAVAEAGGLSYLYVYREGVMERANIPDAEAFWENSRLPGPAGIHNRRESRLLDVLCHSERLHRSYKVEAARGTATPYTHYSLSL